MLLEISELASDCLAKGEWYGDWEELALIYSYPRPLAVPLPHPFTIFSSLLLFFSLSLPPGVCKCAASRWVKLVDRRSSRQRKKRESMETELPPTLTRWLIPTILISTFYAILGRVIHTKRPLRPQGGFSPRAPNRFSSFEGSSASRSPRAILHDWRRTKTHWRICSG